MELSVCIPIYNYAVALLVEGLLAQCGKQSSLLYEVLLVDDGSTTQKERNRLLAVQPNVRYVELPQNIGRSAIRNKLVEMASYENLLFMDCDAGLVDDGFIARYLDALADSPAEVLVGGCCYEQQAPGKERLLRWLYGRNREEHTAAERNTHPYKGFSAFNCLIKRSVLQKIHFNESLRKYGHEDTLLGFDMKRNNIRVLHIDNPAYHLSYDTAEDYLRKLSSSVQNLWLIYSGLEDKSSFADDVKLLRTLLILRKYHLVSVVSVFLSSVKNFFIWNLKSAHPCLAFLDMFKLEVLCRVSKGGV